MTVDRAWQKIKVPNIPPRKFKEILDHQDNIFLLDVRSLAKKTLIKGEEYLFTMDNSTLAGLHIRGARHCPLVFLEKNYYLIPKDKKILISDWIMKQSTIAAKFLISKGYDVVGVLKGGTARWKTEELPLMEGESSLNNQLMCD